MAAVSRFPTDSSCMLVWLAEHLGRAGGDVAGRARVRARRRAAHDGLGDERGWLEVGHGGEEEGAMRRLGTLVTSQQGIALGDGRVRVGSAEGEWNRWRERRVYFYVNVCIMFMFYVYVMLTFASRPARACYSSVASQPARQTEFPLTPLTRSLNFECTAPNCPPPALQSLCTSLPLPACRLSRQATTTSPMPSKRASAPAARL